MKLIILISTLSLFWFASVAQEVSCKKFKTGKFHNIEEGVVKSKIERNDSFQFEEVGDIRIKLKIVWINDCSYRLIFLEGNDAWWKSRKKNMPIPDLIIQITHISDDSYLQESKFVGVDNFKYQSNMLKIE